MFNEGVINRIILEFNEELTGYNLRKMIFLLEKMIELPTDEKGLSGVQRNMSYCINKLFDDKISVALEDYELIAEVFFRIEPTLKKLLYIVNKEKYNDLKQTNKLTLANVLDELKLLEDLRGREGYLVLSVNKTKYSESKNQTDHILGAYKLRNATAHDMNTWNRVTMYENIQDVMITLLFACWKYCKVLENEIDKFELEDELNCNEYIKGIINNYEKKVSSGFKFVPINWTYKPKEFKENCITEHNIIDIRNNIKNEKHVLLLASAGCGKSTSIDYLEYLDAKQWEKNNSLPIPVKICLASTNESWISLEEAICDRVGITYETCKKLLDKGVMNVYLDGVNEVISSQVFKKSLITEIETFLRKYKNIFVLVSDRENVELQINSKMQEYYLHSMNFSDIKKYIESKGIGDEKIKKLIDYTKEMFDNGIKFTPIILEFLVEYIKDNFKLPADTMDMYLGFIEKILEREYREKKDINAAPGRLDSLLALLALHMEEGGVHYIRVLRIFAAGINYLGLVNMDTKACLDLSLQLDILQMKNQRVYFSNVDYYDNLFAKAIEIGMDGCNID